MKLSLRYHNVHVNMLNFEGVWDHFSKLVIKMIEETFSSGDNELPSSVIAVVSNDDLLTEILLRLPVISLVLLKSVSKRWFSLITSPDFALRGSRFPKIDPPSGLFLERCESNVPGEFEYDFLSLYSTIPSKRLVTFSVFSEAGCNVQILDSCNGLFLFRSVYNPHKLYVYNPSTNHLKMIPQPPINLNGLMKIAFDPTKSPHYKVFYAGVLHDDTQLQYYSSETRTWSVCSDLFTRNIFNCFCNGIYWNDAINWLIIYSVTPLLVKLDIVDNTVLTTKLPRTLDERVHYDRKLFQCRGHLLLLCKKDTHSQQLEVYEMKNWYSGWSVKYFINLDDIMNPFPKYWNLRDCVWCIVLREKEEDSFMVIKLYGKVVQYNPVLKTSRELCISESISPLRSYEFTASFAGV